MEIYIAGYEDCSGVHCMPFSSLAKAQAFIMDIVWENQSMYPQHPKMDIGAFKTTGTYWWLPVMDTEPHGFMVRADIILHTLDNLPA